MALHRLTNKHACVVHTRDVVERLRPLVPIIEEEETLVQPAELADWILVEAQRQPDIADHGWRVDLSDEVGLLVHPDRDDAADLLSEQVGVRSVVRLDREVLVVSAPSLCADGLRAAVMQAIGAANERAHHPGPADGRWQAAPDREEGTQPESTLTATSDAVGAAADDDYAPRLVTGDARCGHHRVQIWVNQDGILILPAGTIPHGPLDPSDNPRFQRATFSSAQAATLAEHHAGRWIAYPDLGQLQLRRPGPVQRRWKATIRERAGASVPFSWRGTRPHAMLLWTYVVAECGLEQVDGLP